MKTLSIETFKKMIKAGSLMVINQTAYINNLNVFPVPDGDTGSNMASTIKGGLDVIENKQLGNFKNLAKEWSSGLLYNARGNSGVIFSQIIRGFCSGFKDCDKELTIENIFDCFSQASSKAYSSVSKPLEGTILTVIRLTNEELNKNKENISDIEKLFEVAENAAYNALLKTPELLSILKKVGVVDSGGYGLHAFIKGMYGFLTNKIDDFLLEIKQKQENEKLNESKPDLMSFISPAQDEGFGYCSEIILRVGDKIDLNSNKDEFNFKKFEKQILRLGDSAVIIQDDNIVKVHVHTTKPYKLLEIGQKYGEFAKIKIENMNDQFNSHAGAGISLKDIDENSLSEKIAIIATAPSSKMTSIYVDELGIKNIINTRHADPSVQTLVKEIIKTKSKNVILIIDNKNTKLVADQAIKFVSKKIKVYTILCTNTFETMVLLSEFDQNYGLKNAYKQLSTCLTSILSGVVSKSSKDVRIRDIDINKNDWLIIESGEIIDAKKNRLDAIFSLAKHLHDKNPSYEICCIIHSENIDKKEIEALQEKISNELGLICEVKNGGHISNEYVIGLQE